VLGSEVQQLLHVLAPAQDHGNELFAPGVGMPSRAVKA
jgi:hypothetical protein